MIELTQDLCQELDITYWQLQSVNPTNQVEEYNICHEEKELLRKILLAKGVTLKDKMLEIKDCGVVIIKLNNIQLNFEDVTLPDTKGDYVNLSKLKDMLDSPEQKKHTWYKLKSLDLF